MSHREALHAEPAPDWLTGQLRDLPDPEPPPALFGRIVETRRRRRRRRHLAGVAALAALAVVLAWPARIRQSEAPAPAFSEPRAEMVVDGSLDRQIALLDRRLQAAYDGGASREQIDALWQVRERLAARLQQQDPHQEHGHERILSL